MEYKHVANRQKNEPRLFKVVVIYQVEERTKKKVVELCAQLRACNIDVFMFSESMPIVEDHEVEMEERIRSADLVIICYSENFEKGKGYRHQEVDIALNEQKKRPRGNVYLVPIRLDECEVPAYLNRPRLLDYFKKIILIKLCALDCKYSGTNLLSRRTIYKNLITPPKTSLKTSSKKPPRPLNLFFSYTCKQKHWLNKLKEHLAVLVQEGYLQTWDDFQINPGDIWAETINMNLLNSDIVLFLVTPNFMGSDYAFNVEVRTELRRPKVKDATAVPIILSYANWKNSPLIDLKPLPRNGQPLIEWVNQEAGFRI